MNCDRRHRVGCIQLACAAVLGSGLNAPCGLYHLILISTLMRKYVVVILQMRTQRHGNLKGAAQGVTITRKCWRTAEMRQKVLAHESSAGDVLRGQGSIAEMVSTGLGSGQL